MQELCQSILLSLEIACTSAFIAMLIAIPLAFNLSHRSFAGKSLLEAVFTLPLVLPPTVVGYILIQFLGSQSVVGAYLKSWFDYTILFRFEGAVLAGIVVALPLIYLPAKAGFASVEREYEDIARLYGASSFQIFWHVSLPMSRKAIASGLVLGFARAIGEFGATVMIFGLRPSRTTLPISVYLDYEQGDIQHALPTVLVLCALSVCMILIYNRITRLRD